MSIPPFIPSALVKDLCTIHLKTKGDIGLYYKDGLFFGFYRGIPQKVKGLPKKIHKISLEEANDLTENLSLSFDGTFIQATASKNRPSEDETNLYNKLSHLGLYFRNSGQFVLARHAFQQALKNIERTKGRSCCSYALTLSHLSIISNELQNYSATLDYGYESLVLFEDQTEKPRIEPLLKALQNAHSHLADLARSEERLDGLIYHLTNATTLRKQLEMPLDYKHYFQLNELGLSCLWKHQNGQAQGLFSESFELAEKLSGETSELTVSALNLLALSYFRSHDFKKALELYNDAFFRSRKPHSTQLANATNGIGRIYIFLKEPVKALFYLILSLDVAKVVYKNNSEYLEETSGLIVTAYRVFKSYQAFNSVALLV